MSFFTDLIDQSTNVQCSFNHHENHLKSLTTTELVRLRNSSGSEMKRRAIDAIMRRRGLLNY